MQTHLGGCFFPDPNLYVPEVWAELVSTFNVKSVLDVGCGGGHAVQWFRFHGIDAWGIEGWQHAIDKSPIPDFIWKHDYTTGPIQYIGRNFDLCWCCEFVEHVEEIYISNFVASFKACRVLAMTHATPGQGGYHHVNERQAGYWIDGLEMFGFRFDPGETERFRRMGQGAPYGVPNILIFHNENA